MGSLRALLVTILAVTISIITGCATTPEKPPEKTPTVFFPEPPAPPRIQYLRSFTSNQDIEVAASKFERFVTGEEQSIRRLDKPYGVAIHDGKIYVCDTNNTVMVFDMKSKKFHALQGAKGLGKPVQPLNISIDTDGRKYVSDPVRGQVLVYDRDDFFLKAIGSPAQWTPIDAVPFDDRLYVIDKRERQIWILNKESGALIDKIGRKGDDHTKWLGLPTNIAFDSKGYLYVSDAGRFQVVKLDRDGHFLSAIGRLGTGLAQFSRPRGITTDREGRLFVVDAAFDNIQVFSQDGRLLMPFGKAGSGPGDFYLPAEVVIDYENISYFRDFIDPNFEPEYLIIVTNQFGPRLVNIFAMGKQKGVEYPSEEELLKQLEEMKKKVEEKKKNTDEKREK